ncbi:hypothetical protein [Schlegelella aquatica]|uniref:DUF7300 family protein n=1 Tax=Caldimonas aquatica TaxID=376175 RepID=UPI003751B015
MKATFRTVGDKQLRHFYSIDIEEREDGWRVVYFNSKIHVNKRTRIGPGAYSPEFTYDEILKHVLPYAMRQFGSVIIHCPHCGA